MSGRFIFNVRLFFSRLSSLLLLIFLFFAVALPSGYVFGFNVKALLAFVLAGLFVFSSIYEKQAPFFWLVFSLLMAFLLFYWFVGVVHGVPLPDAISQFVAFHSAFIVIFLTTYYVSVGYVNLDKVILVILYALILVALSKLFVQILVFGGVPFYFVKEWYESVFSVSFIGLDAGWFYRVHFPSDYLIPVSLYAIFESDKFELEIKRSKRFLFCLLLIFSLVISYSRYIWFYALVTFFVLFFYRANASWKLAAVFSVVVGTTLILSVDNVLIDVVRQRYTGDFAESSDSVRFEMFEALISQIEKYPVFGAGLGGSVPGYINIESVPWYFELQWLGFIMQFGIVGASLLVGVSILPLVWMIGYRSDKILLGLSVIYTLWLLVGVFNGFMLTTSGGVIFVMFILLILKFKKGMQGYVAL
jgi:hypothetical protein